MKQLLAFLDVNFFQSNFYILHILAHFFFANIGRCTVVYKVVHADYVIHSFKCLTLTKEFDTYNRCKFNIIYKFEMAL